MSERLLKTLRKSGDFQAEYKGAHSLQQLQRFQYLNASAELHSDKPSRFSSVGLVKVNSISDRADYALIRSGLQSSGRLGDPH